jgi:hypothetical protein
LCGRILRGAAALRSQDAQPVADGATYEEAAARGRNALDNYARFAREDGIALPTSRVYVGTSA